MINLKLRDEIQNIYLLTYTYICLYLPFLSMKSELKENQYWATKMDSVCDIYYFVVYNYGHVGRII